MDVRGLLDDPLAGLDLPGLAGLDRADDGWGGVGLAAADDLAFAVWAIASRFASGAPGALVAGSLPPRPAVDVG